MTDFEARRARMVKHQLERRGISDPRVLAAMSKVARETFIPDRYRYEAYRDGPLPIGEGQTISQPYIVALMAELAAITPEDTVLEVGAGSGYAAAILCELAAHVHAIERIAPLAGRAAQTLETLGYHNVEIHTGDGTRGWPDAAPFDAIVVAAAGDVPQALREQLKPGGRLIIPVGAPGEKQVLKRIIRIGEKDWKEDLVGNVAFVPLITGEDTENTG